MPASAQERKLAQLDNDVAAIYDIVAKLERGQRRHDARFDAIDTRFGRVEAQLGEVTQGVATVIDLVSRPRTASD